ncbi:MAG: TerB family tellurite resistance protein [Myxococcota bacterium]
MDEDFSLDELKLAFSYHIVNQILGSDGAVAPAEAKFLSGTFPTTLMERSGFVSGTGRFTPRWHEALGEALLRLPTLSVPERVQLIDTFFRAATADDEFLGAEAEVMRRAARLLGLQEAEFGQVLVHLVTHEVTLETSEVTASHPPVKP